MGFYLRKSISVGPLRFNLSKSGVGVSAGVKGLRFGVSPRGNYVHMGRGGLYYRATIPSPQSQAGSTHRGVAEMPPANSHQPLQEIESGSVAEMVDSSSRELLRELDRKQKLVRRWPVAALATVVVLYVSFGLEWPRWVSLVGLFAGVVGTYVAYKRDVLAKTVVLFFDFDSETEALYGQLHTTAAGLAGCAAAWHIEASGQGHDKKYHAGANTLVRRKRTSIRKIAPPFLRTNIETISISVGRQTLHFFPDRVLVYDRASVGAVSYRDLQLDVKSTQFIETDAVPSDAKIVGRSWKYVNKSGGPDRRFKDNKELPICAYDEIALSSTTGLNEVLQLSKLGPASEFVAAVVKLGKLLPAVET